MLRSMILRVILIYYSQDFFLRSMPPTPAIPLHLLPFKRWGRIVDLATPASDHPSCKKDHSDASQGLLEQLVSIGFAPGEQVCILAAGKPGNEPLVVRIGTSTSRWPLVVRLLTMPAFSMSSTNRAARL